MVLPSCSPLDDARLALVHSKTKSLAPAAAHLAIKFLTGQSMQVSQVRCPGMFPPTLSAFRC
jgi:hypothetical protein